MKKVLYCMAVCILVAFLAAGCGVSPLKAVAGTWYGDNPDTLVLKANGDYISEWLGAGKYSVKGETVQLSGSGMAEGSLKMLTIGRVDGKKVLLVDGQAVTYFTSASDATAAIKAQEEQNRKEEEERAAAELDALKNELVGTWEWAGYAGEVTFTADGAIDGTVSGMKPGKYEVLDKNNIKVTEETREYTERIALTKDNNILKLTFGTLNLVKK